jgi:hypothetical protein
MCEKFVVASPADTENRPIHIPRNQLCLVGNIVDSERVVNQPNVDVSVAHAESEIARTAVAVAVHVEAVDAYVVVVTTFASEAASVVAPDEESAAERSFGSNVCIAAAAVVAVSIAAASAAAASAAVASAVAASAVAASAVAVSAVAASAVVTSAVATSAAAIFAVAALEKIEADLERSAGLNIAENLRLDFAAHVEDTVAAVDIVAVFAVDTVSAVLVEVAQPMSVVELSAVVGPTVPIAAASCAVELVERLTAIAVAEEVSESVATASALDSKSVYPY